MSQRRKKSDGLPPHLIEIAKYVARGFTDKAIAETTFHPIEVIKTYNMRIREHFEDHPLMQDDQIVSRLKLIQTLIQYFKDHGDGEGPTFPHGFQIIISAWEKIIEYILAPKKKLQLAVIHNSGVVMAYPFDRFQDLFQDTSDVVELVELALGDNAPEAVRKYLISQLDPGRFVETEIEDV